MTAAISDTPTIVVSDELRRSSELSKFVDGIQPVLMGVIGDQYSAIAQDWDLATPTPSSPVVRMTIRDDLSEMSTLMQPSEIDDPWRLRVKLHQSWGGLLQQSVRKMQSNLNKSFQHSSEI